MKTFLSTALLIGLWSASAPAAVVFSDNFNAPDNANFDNSDQAGRRDGLLGPAVQLRSARIQHGISSNQLLLGVPGTGGSGRIRFHDAANTANLHDFASGAAGAAILGAGGFRVEFDWLPVNNTSDQWVSFNVGIDSLAAGEPGTRVNHAGTDFGILFRQNGGSQYFDNGALTNGGNSAASTGLRHVVIDYSFNSFADGSPVSLTASVDGTVVASGNFNWEGNNGVIHMELGSNIAGTRVDNFTLSTIPEPSAAGLFALAGGVATLRRRRK